MQLSRLSTIVSLVGGALLLGTAVVWWHQQDDAPVAPAPAPGSLHARASHKKDAPAAKAASEVASKPAEVKVEQPMKLVSMMSPFSIKVAAVSVVGLLLLVGVIAAVYHIYANTPSIVDSRNHVPIQGHVEAQDIAGADGMGGWSIFSIVAACLTVMGFVGLAIYQSRQPVETVVKPPKEPSEKDVDLNKVVENFQVVKDFLNTLNLETPASLNAWRQVTAPPELVRPENWIVIELLSHLNQKDNERIFSMYALYDGSGGLRKKICLPYYGSPGNNFLGMLTADTPFEILSCFPLEQQQDGSVAKRLLKFSEFLVEFCNDPEQVKVLGSNVVFLEHYHNFIYS
jgi:hypothetical protein